MSHSLNPRGPPGWFTLQANENGFEPAFQAAPKHSNWRYESNRLFLDRPSALDPDVWIARNALGQDVHVAPLFQIQRRNQDPQCSTCLKTVWQCETQEAQQLYGSQQQCEARNQCFVYDLVQPSGRLIPVGVIDTPECRDIAQEALQRCAFQCTGSSVHSCY